MAWFRESPTQQDPWASAFSESHLAPRVDNACTSSRPSGQKPLLGRRTDKLPLKGYGQGHPPSLQLFCGQLSSLGGDNLKFGFQLAQEADARPVEMPFILLSGRVNGKHTDDPESRELQPRVIALGMWCPSVWQI